MFLQFIIPENKISEERKLFKNVQYDFKGVFTKNERGY